MRGRSNKNNINVSGEWFKGSDVSEVNDRGLEDGVNDRGLGDRD